LNSAHVVHQNTFDGLGYMAISLHLKKLNNRLNKIEILYH
jgi:carbonic anhydrase